MLRGVFFFFFIKLCDIMYANAMHSAPHSHKAKNGTILIEIQKGKLDYQWM